jgi:CRP/FNR family cyclic AMP-dependent transcriptional regulator
MIVGISACALVPEPLRLKRRNLFTAEAFLNSAGVAKVMVNYRKTQRIYAQGDSAMSVMYIQRGAVKLSIVSKAGKEAIVALLGPGDFFGEGCLTGLPFRMGTSTAIVPSTVIVVDKQEMTRALRKEHDFSNCFIAYLLTRKMRVEDDLIDQLFNSIEKRVARTLLLLARYGTQDPPHTIVSKISQETLAEIVGTTRSRVNFFMGKFKRLGFIHCDGELRVNNSLLNVILRD